MTDSTDTKPDSINGDQIPWYRWRWLFFTCFVLFFPAAIIIGVTGDIYCNNKGEITKLRPLIKIVTLVVGGLLLAKNILLPYFV